MKIQIYHSHIETGIGIVYSKEIKILSIHLLFITIDLVFNKRYK
jgi:hypothetical protein